MFFDSPVPILRPAPSCTPCFPFYFRSEPKGRRHLRDEKVLTGKVRSGGKSGRWKRSLCWDEIRGKGLVVSDKNKGELRAGGESFRFLTLSVSVASVLSRDSTNSTDTFEFPAITPPWRCVRRWLLLSLPFTLLPPSSGHQEFPLANYRLDG